MFKELYHAPLSDEVEDQDNLIFSPHSIWQAVVLSYLISDGAMETTLEQSLRLEEHSKVYIK
jgi:serine protease inhibitor